MSLSPLEMDRYARHLRLAEVGLAGQQKIKGAKIALVGVGGLGCPAAQYLVAAGIGELHLIDSDKVERSNLPRQILFTEQDIGRNKADAAAEKLRALNSETKIVSHVLRLNTSNVLSLFQPMDIILDATDNFASRYLINDAAIMLNKVWVFAALHSMQAQMAVFSAQPGRATYRCLFPEMPPAGSIPNCEEAGVLNVLAGMMGLAQAAEALKWICGMPMEENCLHCFDLMKLRWTQMQIPAGMRKGVPANEAELLKMDYEQNCSTGIKIS